MFVEEIARAIEAAPRERLAELSAALWKGYSVGALAENDAQRLAELIEARKVMTSQRGSATAPRRTGSRPRSSASLERRRAWTSGGWMPPAIAARFTMGEAAVMAVVVREIALSGRCALPVNGLAGRAGVCATTVRNALRQARALGLVTIEERRVSYDRSLPNIVRAVSRDLQLWMKTRARVEARGGWVQDGTGDPQPLLVPLPSPISPATGQQGVWRGEGRTGSTRARPHPPASRGSTLGPMRRLRSGVGQQHA